MQRCGYAAVRNRSDPRALNLITGTRGMSMRVAVTMERMVGASPRLKARIAGALYLLSFLTAAFAELFARGRLNLAGGLIAVLGMVVVTLPL